MALLRLVPAIVLTLIIWAFAFAFAACGGDDDSDPTPTQPTSETPTAPASPTPRPGETTTPTPDANTPQGFLDSLRQFNRDINSGAVDPIIARVKVVEYTCKASDLQNVEGAVSACTREGEVVRVVGTSTWRSSGSLIKVEDFVANLQGIRANFDTAKSDQFGPGTFRVFAYDDQKHTAVLTAIAKCLPQRQCPETGVQRLVWVPQFEYVDGTWKIQQLMSAFVLGEEFLTANGAGSAIYLPDWKAMQ